MNQRFNVAQTSKSAVPQASSLPNRRQPARLPYLEIDIREIHSFDDLSEETQTLAKNNQK
jgi:hypothetical protein